MVKETGGVGQDVAKVSAKKRLKREWARHTNRTISLKAWVREVIQTKEPEHVVPHAETWALNKGIQT